MGSCVSALIASLGGKKNAKRAAYIHFLFNVFGSLAIVIVLQLFMSQIEYGIMALTNSQNLTGAALNEAMARNVAMHIQSLRFSKLSFYIHLRNGL